MAREFFLHPSRDKMSVFPPPSDENYGTAGTAGFYYSTSGVAYTDYTTGANGNIGIGNVPGNLATGIGNYNQVLSEMVIVSGKWNLTGENIQNSFTVGNNNILGSNIKNSGILGGNNNTIQSDVENSWVISSSFKNIQSDNEIWIGDSIHIIDGVVVNVYRFVDGGIDQNVTLYPETNYTTIDGGLDSTYEEFPEDYHSILDGGLDTIL